MKRKQFFYRHPDAPSKGGAVPETPFADFPDSIDDFDKPAAEEKPKAANAAEGAGDDEGKKPPVGKKGDEEPEKKPVKETPAPATPAKQDGKNKDDESGAEQQDDEEQDDSFDLDEPEDPELKNKSPEEEESTSWVDVAKELNLEGVDEDDFEKFQAGVKTSITKAREEGQNLSLEKYPVEAQNFFKFLSSGKTVEQFFDLVNGYNEVLRDDDKTIITKSFIGQGLSKELADERVKAMEERGELASNAIILRKNIERQRDQDQQGLINEGKQLYEQQQQALRLRKQKEDANLSTAISKLESVLGGKLKDSHRQALLAKSADYRKRFQSDPNFAAQMIALAEYGEAVVKAMKSEKFSEGRNLARKELHNTKTVDERAGRQRSGRSSVVTSKAPFDDWEEIKQTEQKA